MQCMEHFKKELFFQEHSVHISDQTLSDSEKQFLNVFLEQHGINNLVYANFFEVLLQKLANRKDYKSIDTSQQLDAVFQDLAFQNDSEVFVIWRYPSDMNKFHQSYLVKYWEDIWFGASDEAVGIFSPEMGKIIVVTHYGVVYY